MRFIIDIEYTKEAPIVHLYLRGVNIDPNGYPLAAVHGNSLPRLLSAAKRMIAIAIQTES